MSRLPVLLLPTLALALVACASPDATPRGGVVVSSAAPEVCVAPSAELVAQIVAGAEPDVGTLVARSAGAVRSGDFESVYFVAVRFEGDGVSEVGVWASNRLDGTGTILAADAMAQAFTAFPDGDTSAAKIPASGADHRAARECVG